jgi:hypothetical protein
MTILSTRKAVILAIAVLITLSYPANINGGDNDSRIHIADMIQPTPRTSILANDDFFVWGASMVQTDDGVCHLLYSRWPRPFNSWTTDSEIAYATADNPSGPYTFQRTVLAKRGAEYWDGVSVYNPQVLYANGKYYLYYTGNNGGVRLQKNDRGNPITQRVGVAVADHPAGPWKRMDSPLIDLSEKGLDSNFSCNPAVTQTPQGNFLMAYKCGAGTDKKGKVYHTTAKARSPLGPFIKADKKVFDMESSRFPTEDPFIWHQNGRYYAVLKDMHGAFSSAGRSLIQFESRDGHEWEPSKPVLISKTTILWSDGKNEKVERLERPQIWLKDGQPAMLFLAVKEGDNSYNVHIPLAPSSK